MIDLVTEGALLLVAIARGLQLVEHGNMALGALLHGQGLYRLIKERRARRHLLDLVRKVNLAGTGAGGIAQGQYCPGQEATNSKVTT